MAEVMLYYPPLRPEEATYCRLCRAKIFLRPIPVVDGNALCDKCLPKILPNWYFQVYRVGGADVLEDWYNQRHQHYKKASE